MTSAADEIRALLYGDVPLERWVPFAGIKVADAAGARIQLRRVVEDPDRPARDQLQAWHALRDLGMRPPVPDRLFGVVVDMPVDDGLDTLAGYVDGTCRYVNHSGRVLVWEGDNAEAERRLRGLIAVGESVAARIGPWDGPRPPLRPGVVRLSMLCAGGLYFGEGSFDVLSQDPMAAQLLVAATELLQVLVNLNDQPPT